MKFLPLLVLLAAAQLASQAARAADVVLTMNSYGPIRVGMPVAEVHRQLLKLGRKQLPKPGKTSKTGCDSYQASPQLRFMTEDGKVVRIETREPDVVTPSGIRIGSSLDRVRKAFGSRIEDEPQKHSGDPKDRSIVLVAGDRQSAIRVDGNQAVSAIYVGAEHAIRDVEGCP